jgi:phage virion morphogenesis protein
MTGISLKISLTELGKTAERLLELSHMEKREILDGIGAEVETQTKRRIADEKESPDSIEWPEWSPKYEKTRHAGHSLLQNENDLLNSISYIVYIDGSKVEIGTNLIYAATHQFGDDTRNIPARTYLGFSSENLEDIQAIVDDFMSEHMKSL